MNASSETSEKVFGPFTWGRSSHAGARRGAARPGAAMPGSRPADTAATAAQRSPTPRFAQIEPRRQDLWLTVTPIWTVLVASRVIFYALERLRFPEIVPPVTADAIQGVLLWPAVVLGCHITLRAWQRAGTLIAWAAALMTAIALGALARPTYVLASFISAHPKARYWLESLYSTEPDALYGWLSSTIEYGVLHLCCVAAAVGFLSFRSLMNERLLRARVEAAAAQERLRALRAQLNPHFLFNALNSIVSLDDLQSSSSQRLVTELSGLLRRTLRASEREEHELSEELAHVESYLRIQQVRHPERVRWRLQTGRGCLGARVPSLILLPLIENAVTHGLRGAHAVDIEISAERDRNGLLLKVTNTCGTRTPCDAPGGSGLGLRNGRERLHILFGARAALTACRTRLDRFEAQIGLPVSLEQPCER